MIATWRSASTLVWTYCFMVNATSDINVVRSQADQLADLDPAPARGEDGTEQAPLGGDRQNPRRLRRSRFGAATGISCSRMPARSSVADVLGH